MKYPNGDVKEGKEGEGGVWGGDIYHWWGPLCWGGKKCTVNKIGLRVIISAA